MTTQQPRIEIELLDHIQAAASNVEGTVAFYRDVLGARVQSVSQHWALVRLGNVDIGIHLREVQGAGDARAAAAWEPGFRVANIVVFRAQLERAGVPITQEFHEIPGGVNLGFADPDGNPLAVYQYGVGEDDLRELVTH